MFGTLVVGLPSEHKGGEVVLTHNKTKHIFDSSNYANLVTSITFGAWYSNVYHEVRPVTSGYRVVLTYNLVQDTYSVRQMASDGTSEARLQAAFHLWETALKEGTHDDCPPYLLHELEHMYSKNSLKLNTLKGNDLSKVQILDKVCQKLGFDIYLATYEKAVYKDDEYGDEVFNTEEDLKSVTTLDGRGVNVHPDYDASYFVEDHDPEDEEGSEWDESEHEGYTGNEGSPATYWYRDTVVMVVPPSQKLAFSLSCENKWSIVQERLPDVRERAAKSAGAKEELLQYCELIAVSQPVTSWSRGYHLGIAKEEEDEKQRQACLAYAALIALENGWMSMFWRLPAQQKLRPDAVRMFGLNLCLHSTMNMEFELMSLVRCGKGIAGKHSVLSGISTAFKEASPNTEQQQKFNECCKAALREVINQSSGLGRADMSALAAIARTFGVETVSPLVLNLPTNYTENLTEFVLQFTKEDESLADTASCRFLQEVLRRLWHGFQFTGIHQQPMLADEGRGNYWSRSFPSMAWQPKTSQIQGLTRKELSELLAITKTKGVDKLLDALRDMTEAVTKTNSKYVSERLMDFVKAILTHDVPSLIVEDNPEIYDSVSKLISTILRSVIVRWIGEQPRKPADWCLPHKGCGSTRCADCQHVAKFMSDPVQVVLEYQVGVKRCRHLDNVFAARYGDVAQCNTQVDQRKKPFTWKCTKEHKVYKEQLKTWTQRRKEAQAKLSEMGGKNGEGLRMFLGDETDSILICRVEDLPSSEDALPLGGLHASALNVKNSKKRTADHYGGEHDTAPMAKRSRGTSNDPVELSD